MPRAGRHAQAAEIGFVTPRECNNGASGEARAGAGRPAQRGALDNAAIASAFPM